MNLQFCMNSIGPKANGCSNIQEKNQSIEIHWKSPWNTSMKICSIFSVRKIEQISWSRFNPPVNPNDTKMLSKHRNDKINKKIYQNQRHWLTYVYITQHGLIPTEFCVCCFQIRLNTPVLANDARAPKHTRTHAYASASP